VTSAGPPESTPPGLPPGRPRLFRSLRFVLGAAVILAALFVLYGRLSVDWRELGRLKPQVNVLWVVISYVILLTLHFPLGAVCWRFILRGLGERLPVFRCLVIMTITQVGKYAPGKVWFTLGRMSLAKREGIPEAKTLVSVAIEIGFALLAALVLLALAVLSQVVQGAGFEWYVYALFGLIPVCLVILYPPVFNRLLRLGLTRLKRPVFEIKLSYLQLLALTGLYMLDWFVQGVASFILIRSFYAVPLARLPILVGAYAVAWICGFIVLVVPAGIGVKELVYGAVTKGTLGAFSNLSGVVERVWMTSSELLMALICLPFLRRRKTAEPAP